MTNDDSRMTGEGIVLYIMSVTGIVANAFAVLASARLLKMQPLSPNVFVLGLSCVDLMSLIFFSLPSWFFYVKGEWIGGKRLCDFQGFVFLFATLCSAFLATSMAVDRCIAVTRPFFHRDCEQSKATHFRNNSSVFRHLLFSDPILWKLRAKFKRFVLYCQLVP